MKIIHKILFLSVLFAFGGCIAMEKAIKTIQEEIDEIDEMLLVEKDSDDRKALIEERKLKVNLQVQLTFASLNDRVKANEEIIKEQDEIQKWAKQELEDLNRQTALREQQEKVREQQEKLRSEKAIRDQAEFLKKMKRLGEISLVAIPIVCICVPCIYKLYKYYTAKKEDPVDDENDNVENDLQEAFFVKETTEY